MRLSPNMISKMITEFSEPYQIQQFSEEVWRLQELKCCDDNNQDKENGSNKPVSNNDF